ncbi:hypothetical protein ERTO105960_04020 [Erysipelothrix tonsillarum]|nr:hypothetical protein [Erysipelothrix tonsillarum]
MSLMWIIFGILAALFVLLNLYRSLTGNFKHWYVYHILSFACTIFFLLCEYMMILDYINLNDWIAMMDVMPMLISLTTGCALIALVLNGISLYFYMNKKQMENNC